MHIVRSVVEYSMPARITAIDIGRVSLSNGETRPAFRHTLADVPVRRGRHLATETQTRVYYRSLSGHQLLAGANCAATFHREGEPAPPPPVGQRRRPVPHRTKMLIRDTGMDVGRTGKKARLYVYSWVCSCGARSRHEDGRTATKLAAYRHSHPETRPPQRAQPARRPVPSQPAPPVDSSWQDTAALLPARTVVIDGHIVTAEPFTAGRLHRETGQPLCQASEITQYPDLAGTDTSSEPGCMICLQTAARLLQH